MFHLPPGLASTTGRLGVGGDEIYQPSQAKSVLHLVVQIDAPILTGNSVPLGWPEGANTSLDLPFEESSVPHSL
eukprot:15461303-Alexandrium_andersonii.AAC.1